MPSFNSIKVRLKPPRAQRAKRASTQFQFHKGPIKAPIAEEATTDLSCFNSIKVRLKRLARCSVMQRSTSFNSIKVRLKQVNHRCGQSRDICFNSIKVRLKHAGDGNTASCPVFQFHKGPIKAFIFSSSTLSAVEFQFHKGPIKALAALRVKVINQVSIP